MHVCSASSVVTGEGCIELQDAVFVAELNTTKHCVVNIACIGRITIAASNHAAVHTSAVTVPKLKCYLRDWLAGLGVNDLDIESQWYARIAVSDVLADVFARYPWRLRQILGWQE